MNFKLIKVVKSSNPKFKLDAHFLNKKTGKIKIVRFGAGGYEDYTTHKDKERRSRYRKRHQKDLNTNDPLRKGYLSYYILWGDSTSINKNVSSYKKRFNL